MSKVLDPSSSVFGSHLLGYLPPLSSTPSHTIPILPLILAVVGSPSPSLGPSTSSRRATVALRSGSVVPRSSGASPRVRRHCHGSSPAVALHLPCSSFQRWLRSDRAAELHALPRRRGGVGAWAVATVQPCHRGVGGGRWLHALRSGSH